MKWNWGTKLVIAMAIFMGFIIVLVYQSTMHNVNLVEKDYYPKGIKYQDRLDDIANASEFSKQLRIYQEMQKIVVAFPEIHPDTGTITFFRPSTTNLDQIFDLSLDTSWTMKFNKDEFNKGKYILKIFWKEDGTGYYLEKPYYFN